MNLKSIDSEIEGNSIFDSFCFKTILETFNNAKISEESMKDVQIDQFLLSVNFCGLQKKEELSKNLKSKYLMTQAALNVAKFFSNAMVYNKMKNSLEICNQSQRQMLNLVTRLVKKALSQKENFPLIEVLKPFLHKGLIEEVNQLKTLAVVQTFLDKLSQDGKLQPNELKYAQSLLKNLNDKVKGIKSAAAVSRPKIAKPVLKEN